MHENGLRLFRPNAGLRRPVLVSDALVNCSFRGLSVAPSAAFLPGPAFFAAVLVATFLAAGFGVFVAVNILFLDLENRLRRHTTPCATAPS